MSDDLFDGVVVATGALVVVFSVLALLAVLPVSITSKLALKHRPIKPRSALGRQVDGLLQKHGRVFWSFFGGAWVATLLEAPEIHAWWQRVLVVGVALFIAVQLSQSRDNH